MTDRKERYFALHRQLDHLDERLMTTATSAQERKYIMDEAGKLADQMTELYTYEEIEQFWEGVNYHPWES